MKSTIFHLTTTPGTYISVIHIPFHIHIARAVRHLLAADYDDRNLGIVVLVIALRSRNCDEMESRRESDKLDANVQ